MGGTIKRESIHRDPALPLKVIYLHPYKRHKHPLCEVSIALISIRIQSLYRCGTANNKYEMYKVRFLILKSVRSINVDICVMLFISFQQWHDEN